VWTWVTRPDQFFWTSHYFSLYLFTFNSLKILCLKCLWYNSCLRAVSWWFVSYIHHFFLQGFVELEQTSLPSCPWHAAERGTFVCWLKSSYSLQYSLSERPAAVVPHRLCSTSVEINGESVPYYLLSGLMIVIDQLRSPLLSSSKIFYGVILRGPVKCSPLVIKIEPQIWR
jgi:hypothetical protein